MEFQVGDKIDSALVKTVTHEFSRCQVALNQFIYLKTQNMLSGNSEDKKISIAIYNAYSLFVLHLYEFYIGCIIRGRMNTTKLKWDVLDNIINFEVDKTLTNWRDSIDNNYAPSWANHRSYYEDSCPPEFGIDFRSIRNSIAHVDYRRIDGENRIKLSDFYLKYHKYIMLLFEQGRYLWTIKDYNHIDLGDVSEFNKLINKKL